MKIFNMFRQPYLSEDDGVNFGGFNDDEPSEKPTEGEVKEEPKEESKEEPKEEPKEEFDPIVYNGETVQLSAKDRQKYLQMGYHLEHKVQGKLTEYEQTIQEIQALTGLTTTQVIEQLKQSAHEAQIQEYINANPGVSEEYAAEQLKIRNELNQLKENERVRTVTSIREKQRETLKSDPLFSEIDALVQATLQQPTMANNDYETVYNYIAGTPQFRSRIVTENSKKLEEERKLTEKRVIANIHDKKSRGISDNSDSVADEEIEFDSTMKRMTAAFGNELKDIASHIKKNTKK